MQVNLAIGSNLGNRKANLEKAILLLQENNVLNSIIRSKIYENKALLPENSPKDWNSKFLNMVIHGKTCFSATDLLIAIKKIEETMGRATLERWAPRVIDIDILTYENLYMADNTLQIPHKEMLNRNFVLIPLVEVDPEYILQKSENFAGQTLQEILRKKSFEPMELYEG